MNAFGIESVAAWLVEGGLSGATETELLHGFCARCREAGLALSRALAIIDTLHPVYEGRAFRWRGDGIEEPTVLEYGRTTTGQAAVNWRESIFHHMLATQANELRYVAGDGPSASFNQLENIRDEGHSELLALIHRFGQDGVIGEMDCVYSYWCTRRPGGFDEAAMAALRRLVPTLALALKCVSVVRIASTLVEVYLGRDAGQRVLSGRILRGVADRISAVLWFSDLRGFTRITDAAAPGETIALLNDYSDAVISSVHGAGGDVLKLMGDGTLAIFKADDPQEACHRALAAEADLRGRVFALNAARAAAGQVQTTVSLALHIGEVSYGNIGSEGRLDFTVVGPAVNEASRIVSMCRSADKDVLLSADFVTAAAEADRARCVSVGRYSLRGVRRPRELFTLDETAS